MIWFTSDMHLGHSRILEYSTRPFKNVEEMDETIINNWNSVVDTKDTVYLLGDVSFHPKEKTLNILAKLKGTINLIRGNHDKRLSPEALKRFGFVKDLHTVKVSDADAVGGGGTQNIILCHYALRVWEKSHYGAWSLYGHSHSTLPELQGYKSFDIGVDGHNFFPWSYEEVKAKMATKVFVPVDHHGSHEET